MMSVSPALQRAMRVELMAAMPDVKASDDTRRFGSRNLTSRPSRAFIFASSSRTVGLPSRV